MTQTHLLARRYRHPGLDWPVVTLVTETRAVAVDRHLAHMGFGAPERTTTVGTGEPERISFLDWQLLTNPANTAHAIAIARQLDELPAAAEEARRDIAAIAVRLDRSVPGMLPSFYEQAARIFLARVGSEQPTRYYTPVTNADMAQLMVGFARRAEQAHALPVDKDRLHQSFLEFGAAGAVSASTLSDHARSGHCDYEQFREICLQWITKAPPYPKMARDLRRLARTAGLDRQQTDDAMLRAVVRAPTITRASRRFWHSYKDAMVSLAARDPEFVARLVDIVPDDAHGMWLGILTECGVLAAMPEPAKWLSRFVASVAATQQPYQHAPLRKLVRSMAARLRAAGDPVDLFHNGTNDLHLLDLCLAEGIPVTVPTSLSLGNNLNTKVPHRDLVALAKDERFREVLVDAIDDHLPRRVTPKTIRELTALPGLRMAIRSWLEDTADDIARTGIRRLKWLVSELEGVRASGEVFPLAPEAAQRIADVDVAAKLAKTMRAGLFDELGWPAMEEAFKRIFERKRPQPGDRSAVTIIGEGWPALCLQHHERILVVGPDGVLLDHLLRVPQRLRSPHGFHVRSSYVDGQLLVWWTGPSGSLAYWSDRPGDVFTPTGYTTAMYNDPPPPASLELADRSRFTGGATLRAGETRVPLRVPVHSTGADRWRSLDGSWLTVDESTGAMTKSALPPFFEHADLEHSWVRPVAPGTEGSPLGSAAGLHGWRVRTDPDRGVIGEGLDGAEVRLNKDDHVPLAALHLPGRADPLTVTTCGPNWLELFDTDEIDTIRLDFGFYRPWLARGTPLVPPLQWWHCLRVRDYAGSHALRRVSVHTARKLMDAARAGTGSAAVGRLLPEITHPELLAGVHGLVDYALSIENDLVAVRESAAAAAHSEPDFPAADSVKEATFAQALNLQGAPPPRTFTVDTELGMLDLLRVLRALVSHHEAGAPLPTHLLKSTNRVESLTSLAYPGMLAWQAASPLTRRKHREALVELLTAMAETGLTEPGGRWRLTTLFRPADRWAETSRETVVPAPGGFTVKLGSIVDTKSRRHLIQAIQYSKVPGFFPDPPGYTVTWSAPLETSFDVAGFTKALAEHGVLPWRPEAVTELSARTGMNQGKAALLLGGLPGVAAGHNALDAQDRLLLGLSGSRAAAAKEAFAQLAEADRFALLQAMVPADPAALWSDGPDVAAVAGIWVKRFGRSVPVDEHTLGTVRRYTDIATIADADKWAAHLAKFDIWKLRDAVDLLWLLAYRLPVGSPLRARLPEALASLRTAVQGRVMPLNDFLSSANLGTLLRLPEDEATTKIDVDGWLTLHRLARSRANYSVEFRPSAYRSQNRDVFTAVLDRLGMPGYLVTTMDGLASQGLADACAQHVDAAPGSYLQNPLVTVPDLVERVAKRYTVDSDVAVLYLQLLALPDPNDTNTARWTGWSPARLRAARLALADSGLVLVATRERSGRSLFLPGGWQIQSRPRRSMETWKLSMFEHSPVPHRTVAESFRLAWRRIEDGDIPAYQELQQ